MAETPRTPRQPHAPQAATPQAPSTPGSPQHTIHITWPTGRVTATLDDTPTSRALLAALPLESRAATWGEEVYFDTRLSPDLERDARQVVEPGTVAFWTEGDALALPYGPTPISRGDECRLAAPCNVLGRIDGDPRALATVRPSDPVRVTPAPR
ncbi:cyclophilin-like fold protein [Streptomyces sp. TRM70308]|uniref:cyclophilin-like fold protein n=1 Tax=Streptomyces sp. TRM70308 TaxID=3131932 RepID=UPI003CFC8123